ncbi:hypothetical protein ACLKA6_007072 [Drosophila palustris]
MSKVLSPHKQQTVSRQRPRPHPRPRPHLQQVRGGELEADLNVVSMDLDTIDYTSGSSIIEFLAKEQDCSIEPADPDSIFQEVSRLSDNTDMRSVDELLLEAERLIQQQLRLGGGDGDGDGDGDANGNYAVQLKPSAQVDRQTPSSSSPQSLSSPQNSIKLNTRYTRSIEHVKSSSQPKPGKPTSLSPKQAKAQESNVQTPQELSNSGNFVAFVENLPSESVISEESTPKDMLNMRTPNGGEAIAQFQLEQLDNTDDDEDTVSS